MGGVSSLERSKARSSSSGSVGFVKSMPNGLYCVEDWGAECDYGEIEKTCMFAMTPESTVDEIVRKADEAAELGFTASYIYAAGITERARIVEVLGAALPRVQQG